jgi:hypothetical protein
MPTDQVESLTRDKDARRVIDALPVRDAGSLKDLIAQDHMEEDNRVSEGILSALSWLFYAVALGSLALMAWALFKA